MTPSYDQDQIVYSFTYSANSSGGLSFPNDSGQGKEALQTYVNTVETAILADSTIQGMIGDDWQAVWGPIVYVVDQTGATVHADNTMGCYYSPSQNLFVVAIAGTNPNSMYDWIDEDFEVSTTVYLNQVVPNVSILHAEATISSATNNGLQILLNNMVDSNGDSMLAALTNFISAQSISGATVAVTGHSLAGALSPVLALYMNNTKSTWDPTGATSISVYASAGPTPGNSVFAHYYEDLIKDGDLTYSSIVNSLDVVPQAWQQSELETIPAIYNDYIAVPSGTNPPNEAFGIIISGMQYWASKAGAVYENPYTQVSTNRNILPGTFDQATDDSIVSIFKGFHYLMPSSLKQYVPYVINVARFAAQAVSQHTTQYQILTNVTAFNTEYQAILAANAPADATSTDAIEEAVKRHTNVSLSSLKNVEAKLAERK